MRLGFIVNPLAGAGGPLALKGSDGLGLNAATGWAAARAALALKGLAGTGVTLLTGGGAMGEDLAVAAGFAPHVVHRPAGVSTAADTTACVEACAAAGAQLIIFVGGDGTARDVLAAAPDVPVLGVPAGVKMHSSVFATSPGAAAAMLGKAMCGPLIDIVDAEVIDRDAAGTIRLHGTVKVLAHPARQAAKAARADADAALSGAIAEVKAMVSAAPLCLIGPGLTMHRLKMALAGKGTMLGVDVFAGGALLIEDATQAQLLALPCGALLVLGVVGGQGFLLGRGNQQLGPDVL
ncbi:ATP-NAD kinase family protein, partial [Sandarakinorhabdus limnophila]|uniref:ATP-NAD kinase family protein n=1 Tax=Sandarakinorhabdus limnophila TaxID=210512 RepID=UPI002354683E